MEKWPNFFIVGAPKSGTTSLYEYFKQNPDIFMSPTKEPHYFSLITVPRNHPWLVPVRDREKYLKLFNKVKNEKIIGEASATYLADPKAPELIHKVSPDARILISLRNPVERAFSHYLMLKSSGLTNLSFREEIKVGLPKEIHDYSKPYNETLLMGLYADSIKRYMKIFGSSKVKIIFLEEWSNDRLNSINEILRFLKVNSKISENNEKKHNPYYKPKGNLSKFIVKSGGPVSKISHYFIPKQGRDFLRDRVFMKKEPKPKLESQDVDFLVEFYRNDVLLLENVLKRKLPWTHF